MNVILFQARHREVTKNYSKKLKEANKEFKVCRNI